MVGKSWNYGGECPLISLKEEFLLVGHRTMNYKNCVKNLKIKYHENAS